MDKHIEIAISFSVIAFNQMYMCIYNDKTKMALTFTDSMSVESVNFFKDYFQLKHLPLMLHRKLHQIFPIRISKRIHN